MDNIIGQMNPEVDRLRKAVFSKENEGALLFAFNTVYMSFYSFFILASRTHSITISWKFYRSGITVKGNDIVLAIFFSEQIKNSYHFTICQQIKYDIQ